MDSTSRWLGMWCWSYELSPSLVDKQWPGIIITWYDFAFRVVGAIIYPENVDSWLSWSDSKSPNQLSQLEWELWEEVKGLWHVDMDWTAHSDLGGWEKKIE